MLFFSAPLSVMPHTTIEKTAPGCKGSLKIKPTVLPPAPLKIVKVDGNTIVKR